MKIAIIGSGNAGQAHAFKFTQNGHTVSLIKTSHTLHEDSFHAIQEAGGIWCLDQTMKDEKSFQKIHLITRNMEEGLRGAELIVIMTQSLQHIELVDKIVPFLDKTTKMLLLIPGNLGSLFFYPKIKARSIILSEGESTPYDARISSPGVVTILYKNVRNALSFLPVSRKIEGMSIASKLVDTYRYTRNNIIESALHNPNLVVHTIGVIMSASRIEMMKGEFWMYKESFSPSIWHLIRELDAEKNRVIKLFKGEQISYLDACKFRNEIDLSKNSLDVFNNYAATGGPKGPVSLKTRYLYEDVLTGLCLLSSLAHWYEIATPVTDSLITIASALVNYDFRANARTMKDFGIEGVSKDEFVHFINS